MLESYILFLAVIAALAVGGLLSLMSLIVMAIEVARDN